MAASARPRSAADRGLPGAPRAGLPGRLHPLAGAVAQAARQPQSAGRVQSVALRLICEREAEIEAFRAREYWTVEAEFTTPAGAPFTARLTHLEGKRLEQFDLNNEALAMRAKRRVEAGRFTVGSVEKKRVKRNPPPPFTTSTLQQEASRKLGFGAQQTMRLAQQLYEGVEIGGETTGLITYMRTDGVQMAREAIAAIRDHVRAAYGATTCRPRRASTRARSRTRRRRTRRSGRPTSRARPTASRRICQPRSAAALRADLEAGRRVADAVGRTGSGQRRRDRRQAAPRCAPPARSSRSTASSSCIARTPTMRPRRKRAACCRRWPSAIRCGAAT